MTLRYWQNVLKEPLPLFRAKPDIYYFSESRRDGGQEKARAGGSGTGFEADLGEEADVSARRLPASGEEHDEDTGGDDDGTHENDGTGTKELGHGALLGATGWWPTGPRVELVVEITLARLNPI